MGFAASPSFEDGGSRIVRVSEAGILLCGARELVIEPGRPEVGRAVCVVSGSRLAFRRVLEVRARGAHGEDDELRLRADVAPFEDTWRGKIEGVVRARLIDRVAAIDPERFTQANWTAAVTFARVSSERKRLIPKRPVAFETRVLSEADWPAVRAFWKRACGKELPVEAQPRQHVIGLFVRDELVGANIHLVFGATSYSAFTLTDRRYRGKGGGGAMLKHAITVARAQKLSSIYVHINVRNLPSIAAYTRAGFVDTGWWKDDSDPLASAERQWRVLELDLTRA